MSYGPPHYPYGSHPPMSQAPPPYNLPPQNYKPVARFQPQDMQKPPPSRPSYPPVYPQPTPYQGPRNQTEIYDDDRGYSTKVDQETPSYVYDPTKFQENDKERSRSSSSRDETWRGRSRSRSRSPRRSLSRSPRRYGSRSRSPRRRRSRTRSRSRSRSRQRSRSRSRTRSRSNDRYPRYVSRSVPKPSETVVLKGLPPEVDEDQVWKLVNENGFRPKDVRIMKRKDSGHNRGFGFIEFLETEDAQSWLHKTKGRLRVGDSMWADMEFSMNRPPPPVAPGPSAIVLPAAPGQRHGDWICAKCGLNNFKKRDECFKCGIRREESEMLVDEGFTQIGIIPSDTLLLRKLPSGCDELRIKSALKSYTSLDAARVAIAPSCSFAYVQMESIGEATQLLTTLTQMTTFIIDGKEITVTYSKMPLTAILTGANLTQTADGEWEVAKHAPNTNMPSNAVDVASVVAEFAAQQNIDKRRPQSDLTNSAAAVAQGAIRKAQVVRHAQQIAISEANLQKYQAAQLAAASAFVPGAAMILQTQQHMAIRALQDAAMAQIQQQKKQKGGLTLGTVQTQYGELPRYPAPDTSQYQYEESSGYYFDPSTGLYYDANSRYYLNAETHTWLFWDSQLQTYLPAPTSTTEQNDKDSKVEEAEETEATKKERKEKEEQEDKARLAKKTQKEMEKWAKAQNKKKNQVAVEPTQLVVKRSPERSSGVADMAFNILEKNKTPANYAQYEMDTDLGDNNNPLLSTSPGMNTQSPVDPDTDWDKLACLLCRRQFPSKEVLIKHNQMSGLHKKNLEAKRASESKAEEVESDSTVAAMQFAMSMGHAEQTQYRDRAKERRKKYGLTDPNVEDKNRIKEDVPGPSHFEQPTVDGIKDDNIGNRMLKSMGWREGKGLGRAGQGIVDPITQDRRVLGAGLGATGAKIKDAGRDYKANLRQSLRERFFELNEQP